MRQTSRSKARPVHSRILSCCATTQSRTMDLEISAICREEERRMSIQRITNLLWASPKKECRRQTSSFKFFYCVIQHFKCGKKFAQIIIPHFWVSLAGWCKIHVKETIMPLFFVLFNQFHQERAKLVSRTICFIELGSHTLKVTQNSKAIIHLILPKIKFVNRIFQLDTIFCQHLWHYVKDKHLLAPNKFNKKCKFRPQLTE